MKITAIINSLQGGGAERVLSLLSHEWANIGHRVDLLTFRESTLTSPAPATLHLHPALSTLSSKPRSLPVKLLMLPALLWRIRSELRRLKPEIVVCFMDQANILTLLATIGMSIPIVVSERIYPAHSSLFTSFQASPLRWALSRLRNLCYRRAARIVLQSDRSIPFFPSALHSRILVIPNPIAPPSNSGIAIEIPRPTILTLGRLTTQKRFDLVISAFHTLHTEFPEWHLLVAGSGPEAEALHTQAENGPGASQIHFLGYQGNTAALFAQSELFVLASDFEGFPVALGEALISGVPAIATDCLTGPREILGENQYGILVPTADSSAIAAALRQLIGSPESRQRYAGLGQIRAQEFALPKVVPLWIQMMEEIPKNNSNL